jgi:chemotaxis protein methyltransferase CheR
LPCLHCVDAIFPRNKMIYFSQATKCELLTRLAPLLRPGGYFVISHSESLHGVSDQLKMVQPSIYRKPERPT